MTAAKCTLGCTKCGCIVATEAGMRKQKTRKKGKMRTFASGMKTAGHKRARVYSD